MPIRPLALSVALVALSWSAGTAAQSNERGLDARNLDAKTAACTDFWQYANGGWLKANPVPAGFGSWGLFDEMAQRNLAQQRALLESAASAPQDDLDRLLGAIYASGMDEAAIEAAGAQPLQPLFERIAKIRKPKDIGPTIADLHARGVPVLFDFGAADDLENPVQRIAYANQGGLGLPDRDYYLRANEETKPLLAAYRAYIERVLALAGSADAAREADLVLQMETRLANKSLTLLQLRDPKMSYRVLRVKDIDKTFPTLGFKKFVAAQGLKKLDTMSLAHVDFFAEAEAMAKTLPPAQWQAYLRFHTAHALAPYLSKGFQDAHEALYVRTLRGMKEPLPRWRRVLYTVDSLLGQGLGRKYAEKHLPEADRKQAEALVTSIHRAQRDRLQNASWLGTLSKQKALEKLDALDVKIGYPPNWPSYEGLAFQRNAYAANVLATVRFRHAREMAGVGKPREDWQWPQPPHAVNAYYDPSRNQLVVPAGFLQPPLFDAAAEPALNYGGVGALLAHELFHGFDVIGAQYDAHGKPVAWWDPADATAFTSRFKPLEAQYDAYTALGPVKVSGRLTFAENIADLAGIETAWSAFAATQPDAAKIDGHTPSQRFFLAWAQAWRRNYTDDELTALLQTDVHAPAKFRVVGPLANFAPFSAEFKCKAGAGFVRKEAERIAVW